MRGFLSGGLTRLSLGVLWVSPRVFRVSFRIQKGENKQHEREKQETVKIEEQEVEQQKHMTEEEHVE